AIDCGASTISTPSGASPSSPAGPNRITRAPRAAASAAPAATSAGPRSAPLQSTATTASPSAPGSCVLAGSGVVATAELLVVLVLVVVRSAGGRHDLAAGVVPTDRADAVRPARTVALRACVYRRRADLVLCASLGGAAVRLLFLGDGHALQKATSRAARPYSSLSSRSFAQRGSGAASWSWPSTPLRSAAQIGHSPAQSSRQSTLTGAASAKASRAHAARSSVSSCTYGLSSSSPSPGRSTSRASTSTIGAADFRQRMHGPLSAPEKRRRSA